MDRTNSQKSHEIIPFFFKEKRKKKCAPTRATFSLFAVSRHRDESDKHRKRRDQGDDEFYNVCPSPGASFPRINVIRGGTEPRGFLIKSTAPPLSHEFIIAPILPRVFPRCGSRPLFSRHEALMSNNSNFYAFPRGAIKEEERTANISKKQGCLHRGATYFLLNKISSGYDNQLGCVLPYYTAAPRGYLHHHLNKRSSER